MSTEQKRPDDLLTIAEAAATLRVSYSTLRRWETAGLLDVERTHTGQRRYRRHVIESAVSPAA